MTVGDITAEIVEQLGSLIGGTAVDFVSFCLKNCQVQITVTSDNLKLRPAIKNF